LAVRGGLPVDGIGYEAFVRLSNEGQFS
jgi:hypothetical protein